MKGEDVFVGLDVAKARLDAVVRPTGESWQVPNDEDGIARRRAATRPADRPSGPTAG